MMAAMVVGSSLGTVRATVGAMVSGRLSGIVVLAATAAVPPTIRWRAPPDHRTSGCHAAGNLARRA
jgi:hypothetical protein